MAASEELDRTSSGQKWRDELKNAILWFTFGYFAGGFGYYLSCKIVGRL
jgi:hypothetical protein